MAIQLTGPLYTTGSITASAGFNGTASYANNALSSSYAVTASYALNAGTGSGFPFSGSAVITGSLTVNGLDVNANQGFTNFTYNINSAITSSVIDITGKNYIKLNWPTSSTVWNPTYTLGFSGSLPGLLPEFIIDAYQSYTGYSFPTIFLSSSADYKIFPVNTTLTPNIVQLTSNIGQLIRNILIVDNDPIPGIRSSIQNQYYRSIVGNYITTFISSSDAALYQFVSGSNVWNTTTSGTGSIFNSANTSSVRNLANGNTASWSNPAILLSAVGSTGTGTDRTGYYCTPTTNGFLSSSADTVTFTSASGIYGATFFNLLGLTPAQTQSRYTLMRAEDNSFELFLQSTITGSSIFYIPYLAFSQSAYVVTGSNLLSALTTGSLSPTGSSNVYVGFVWTKDYTAIVQNTTTAEFIPTLNSTYTSNVLYQTGSLPASTTTKIEYFGTSATANSNFIGLAMGASFYTGSDGYAIYTPNAWGNAFAQKLYLPSGF